MPQTEKELLRRIVEEAWNKGNLNVLDELFATDIVTRHPNFPAPVRGVKEYKRLISNYREAFPDLRFNIEEIVSEGNKVVMRYTITGTQRGVFRGTPPTNKRIEYSGIAVTRVENGKAVEQNIQSDHLGLFRQLGLIEEARPGTARAAR